MTRLPTIRRPPPEGDRPKAWTVALVAAAALAAGVALVARTSEPSSDGLPTRAPPSSTEGPQPAPATFSTPDAGARAESVGPRDAGAQPSPPAATTVPRSAPVRHPAAVSTPPASAPSIRRTTSQPSRVGAASLTHRVIVQGRVAYLVCEGVPKRKGSYPCPRDLDLEEAVWNVLDALPQCPTAPAGTGRVDVRLEFIGAPMPKIGFFPARTNLDAAALQSCLAGPLGALRTSLPATHMIVSFRFRMETR